MARRSSGPATTSRCGRRKRTAPGRSLSTPATATRSLDRSRRSHTRFRLLAAVPRAPEKEQSENHEDYDQGRDEPVRPHPAHSKPSSVVHQVRFSRLASPPPAGTYCEGFLSNFALQEAEQNT